MRLPVNGWLVAGFLLTTLLAVGAWDFERAIARLDAIDENTRLIDKQGAANTGDIADLKPRVSVLEGAVQDHERRIIRMEPRP